MTNNIHDFLDKDVTPAASRNQEPAQTSSKQVEEIVKNQCLFSPDKSLEPATLIHKEITTQDRLLTPEEIESHTSYLHQLIEMINSRFGNPNFAELNQLRSLAANLKFEKDIEQFNADFERLRFELAQRCARQDGGTTAEYISWFAIESPDERAKIALRCAMQNPYQTATWIRGFALTDQEALIQILYIIVVKSPIAVLRYIGHFKITDQQTLINLIQECAETDGGATAQHIHNFDIKDQQALCETAMLCAKQNPQQTALHIKNFNISNKDRLQVLLVCLKNNQSLNLLNMFDARNKVSSFLEYNGADDLPKIMQIEENLSVIQQFFAKENMSYFHNYSSLLTPLVKGNETNTSFEQKKENQLAQVNLLGPALALMDATLSPTQMEKLLQNPLIPAILNCPYSDIQWKLIVKAVELANHDASFLPSHMLKFVQSPLMADICERLRPDLRWRFILQAFELSKNEGALEQIKAGNWRAILAMILERNCSQGCSKDLTHQILEIGSHHLFKDSKSYQPLLESLLLLAENNTLNTPSKDRLLKKLVALLQPKKLEETVLLTRQQINQLGEEEKKSLKKKLNLQKEKQSQAQKEAVVSFIQGTSHLLALLAMNDRAICEADDTRSLSELMQASFKRLLPLKDSKNFSENYLNTFGASRNPSAFVTYAAKISTLKNSDTLKDLATFMESVLDGTYKEIRHSSHNNPHLQQLAKTHPVVLHNWFQEEPSFALSTIQQEENKTTLSYRQWLYQKLIQDKHIDDIEVKAPSLYFALIGSTQTGAQTEFSQLALDLIEAKGEEAQVRILTQMANLPLLKGTEFLNDIQGQINSFTKTTSPQDEEAVVIDTEDPIDLVLSGEEVLQSCQRVDGDPEYNKGLLGTLLDGKIRMIAVKSKKGAEGKILARALLKILWDGEKPVLFLERFYFNGPASERHKKAIIEMASRKAKRLGLELVSKDGQGTSYDKPLQSLGGPASFEYSDGSGLRATEKGKYMIEGAKRFKSLC
jgi:hypothetical protein